MNLWKQNWRRHPDVCARL